MRWWSRIFLRIKLWYIFHMKKIKCEQLVQAAFPEGSLTEVEIGIIKLECLLETPYLEIISKISFGRSVGILIALIKKDYPQLSEEEVMELVTTVAKKLKSGKNAEKVFTEIIKPKLENSPKLKK